MADQSVTFTALGSGSKGNAFAVQAGGHTLLVDAGFSCRELTCRLTRAGIAPDSVRAVLLTHDHCDHACGCRVFCDKMQIPLYSGSMTVDYLDQQGNLPARVFEFQAGNQFELAGFEVSSFPVSHDACEPVGFVLRKGAVSLGIATDLGIADAAVRNALTGCNMLVFESNYDSAMLDASSRPLHTKRRIRSFKGHMGNDDAMQELPDLIGEETQMITLVHVSRECNDYSLVDSMARNMLSAIHREDIYLDVARQDDICRPFCFCRS